MDQPAISERDERTCVTDRQQAILTLLAEGLDRAQITRRLFISCRTFDRDVAKAAELLGAENRVALGAMAVAHGIIRIPRRSGENAPQSRECIDCG